MRAGVAFNAQPAAAAVNVLPDFVMKADEVVAHEYSIQRLLRRFFGKACIDNGSVAVVLELGLGTGAAPWAVNLVHG